LTDDADESWISDRDDVRVTVLGQLWAQIADNAEYFSDLLVLSDDTLIEVSLMGQNGPPDSLLVTVAPADPDISQGYSYLAHVDESWFAELVPLSEITTIPSDLSSLDEVGPPLIETDEPTMYPQLSDLFADGFGVARLWRQGHEPRSLTKALFLRALPYLSLRASVRFVRTFQMLDGDDMSNGDIGEIALLCEELGRLCVDEKERELGTEQGEDD